MPNEVIYVKLLLSCKVLYKYKKHSLNFRSNFFITEISNLWVPLMWARHRWY